MLGPKRKYFSTLTDINSSEQLRKLLRIKPFGHSKVPKKKKLWQILLIFPVLGKTTHMGFRFLMKETILNVGFFFLRKLFREKSLLIKRIQRERGGDGCSFCTKREENLLTWFACCSAPNQERKTIFLFKENTKTD